MQRLLHPGSEFAEQWLASGLPSAQSHIYRLAADLIFDGIQRTDPGQGFGRGGRGVHDMDLVELAPGVRPAPGFINVLAIKMVKTSEGVGLESALESLQVLPRMFALPIFRVCKPYSGSSRFAGRPVVAHIGPESAGFGLAVTGRKHGDRSIVGVQLATSENMLLDGIHQRSK